MTADLQRRLVDRLVADATPVRRLRPPWQRAAAWGVVVVSVLVALGTTGMLRVDLDLRLREPGFLLEAGAAAVTAALLGWWALTSAVPGLAAGRAAATAVTVLVVTTLALLTRVPMVAQDLAPFVRAGVACAVMTAVLALAPWTALVIAVGRGAPLSGARVGALAGAAAWLAGFALMRLKCPQEELLHVVVWHGLPVAAGIAASAVLGWMWLARWRRGDVRAAAARDASLGGSV